MTEQLVTQIAQNYKNDKSNPVWLLLFDTVDMFFFYYNLFYFNWFFHIYRVLWSAYALTVIGTNFSDDDDNKAT